MQGENLEFNRKALLLGDWQANLDLDEGTMRNNVIKLKDYDKKP